jgi:hypothetical protein
MLTITNPLATFLPAVTRVEAYKSEGDCCVDPYLGVAVIPVTLACKPAPICLGAIVLQCIVTYDMVISQVPMLASASLRDARVNRNSHTVSHLVGKEVHLYTGGWRRGSLRGAVHAAVYDATFICAKLLDLHGLQTAGLQVRRAMITVKLALPKRLRHPLWPIGSAQVGHVVWMCC